MRGLEDTKIREGKGHGEFVYRCSFIGYEARFD